MSESCPRHDEEEERGGRGGASRLCRPSSLASGRDRARGAEVRRRRGGVDGADDHVRVVPKARRGRRTGRTRRERIASASRSPRQAAGTPREAWGESETRRRRRQVILSGSCPRHDEEEERGGRGGARRLCRPSSPASGRDRARGAGVRRRRGGVDGADDHVRVVPEARRGRRTGRSQRERIASASRSPRQAAGTPREAWGRVGDAKASEAGDHVRVVPAARRGRRAGRPRGSEPPLQALVPGERPGPRERRGGASEARRRRRGR